MEDGRRALGDGGDCPGDDLDCWLACSVHLGQAKDQQRDARVLAEHLEELLGREFGGPIVRDRIGRMVLGHGQRGRAAVDIDAAGVDEVRIARKSLRQIQRRRQVGGDVLLDGFLGDRTFRHQRCQVNDRRHFRQLHRLLAKRLAQVTDDRCRAGIRSSRQGNDLGVSFPQALPQMASDEPRRPGEQQALARLHG